MMIERIVATRPDGGVNIVAPSERCLLVCTGAGAAAADPWRQTAAWRRRQVANFQRPGIDRRTNRPIPGLTKAIAERWVEAFTFGGLTLPEFFGLLGDKDAGRGASAIQLTTLFDLPADRWFRDAWRRSRDGGPIVGAVAAARGCHLRNLDELVRRWNRAEWERDDAAHLDGRRTNGPALIDWPAERPRILAAVSAAGSLPEIRAIWPDNLPPADAVRGLRFLTEPSIEAADGLSSVTDAGADDHLANAADLGAREYESHPIH